MHLKTSKKKKKVVYSSSIVNEVIRVILSLFYEKISQAKKRIKSKKKKKSPKTIKIKKKKKIQSIKSQASNLLPLRRFMRIKMLSFLFLFVCLTFLCF